MLLLSNSGQESVCERLGCTCFELHFCRIMARVNEWMNGHAAFIWSWAINHIHFDLRSFVRSRYKVSSNAVRSCSSFLMLFPMDRRKVMEDEWSSHSHSWFYPCSGGRRYLMEARVISICSRRGSILTVDSATWCRMLGPHCLSINGYDMKGADRYFPSIRGMI